MASSVTPIELKTPGWLGFGDPSPQRVDGSGPGLLALHGFGGTPTEVALLLEVAEGLGIRAAAPLLPGHGTHPDDLADKRFSDWIQEAEHALSELYLANGQKPVIVSGISLGSLLALELALRHPERVRCLVLLANALWLRSPFPSLALDLAASLHLPDFKLPKLASDLGDPAARRSHLTYAAQPVHAAIDVQRAAKRLRGELSRITCPTLFVHGARDRLCPAENVKRAMDAMTQAEVSSVVLPRSRHIVTRDVERREVARRITSYLKLELAQA